jgi:polyribonucleotide 5'-hydroxyl-kinase
MAAAGGAAQPPRQYKLAPQSELRVEVPPDAPVRVRLVAGTAEVFGTELPPEGWVPVPPRSKIAIFTWHGATVELDGVSESEYTSDEVISSSPYSNPPVNFGVLSFFQCNAMWL